MEGSQDSQNKNTNLKSILLTSLWNLACLPVLITYMAFGGWLFHTLEHDDVTDWPTTLASDANLLSRQGNICEHFNEWTDAFSRRRKYIIFVIGWIYRCCLKLRKNVIFVIGKFIRHWLFGNMSAFWLVIVSKDNITLVKLPVIKHSKGVYNWCDYWSNTNWGVWNMGSIECGFMFYEPVYDEA